MKQQYVRQWQIPSSKAGKTYIVSLSHAGEWSCACVGWTSHTPRKACKHIKLAKETGSKFLLWGGVTIAVSPEDKERRGGVAIAGRGRAITFED